MSAASVQDVLLTGATGFLGAHLLAELLRQPQMRVHCLVRAADAASAWRRVEASLRQYQLLVDGMRDRVHVLTGDLEQPMLGLGQDRYRMLATRLSAIYHNGALVNYVLPYSKVQKANVQATQEIIRLASKRQAPVHYVSTLRLFDARIDGAPIRETDVIQVADTMHSGYAQSKWMSEKLVRSAGERGIPYAIYRPGLVCGDGVVGAPNENDAVSRFIKGCAGLRSAPRSELQLNLTPVDFVVRALVALSQRPQSHGCTFHLVNDEATRIDRTFDAMLSLGYQLEMLPYASWVERLRAAAGADNARDLVPLAQYFDERLPANSQRRVFDSVVTREHLAATGIRCRTVDDALLMNNLRGMQRCGFLPTPAVLAA